MLYESIKTPIKKYNLKSRLSILSGEVSTIFSWAKDEFRTISVYFWNLISAPNSQQWTIFEAKIETFLGGAPPARLRFKRSLAVNN